MAYLHDVTVKTGSELDAVGIGQGLYRNWCEPDDAYRERLLCQWQSLASDDPKLVVEQGNRCGRCGTTRRNDEDTAHACGCSGGFRSAELLNGKWVNQPIYRMSDDAVEHFAKPEVQAWMRECLAVDKMCSFTVTITGNPVALGVGRSRLMTCNWYPCSHGGTAGLDATWKRAIDEGRAYADAYCQPLAPEAEKWTPKVGDRVRAKNCPTLWQDCTVVGFDGEFTMVRMASARPGDEPGGFFAYNLEPLPADKPITITTAAQYRELSGKPAPAGMFDPLSETLVVPVVQSPNCASCGDVLNERWEPTVDGMHSMCADRERGLAEAERPKAMGVDPYEEHCYREISLVLGCGVPSMDEINRKHVSRFVADQPPPSEFRERFGKHVWECDEGEP
jgi:hypothetical protein